MALNYKVSTARGCNVVDANPQRLESADGTRWACGRNVKRSLPDRRWEPVEVWTLRTRDANGKAMTVRTHVGRAEAEAWCGAA